MTARLSAIDFTSDLEKLTKDFTGRQWVFDDIDRWLRESNERFFIFTGEPGVGKSAIAARLTQIRNDVAAYHFCRAGDVETVRPGRILRSLAAQLGEHLPDYGEALANTIKPIHLRVEVNINIGSMTGSQVTGVYIENLKESDPENELDILIRAPLEELQKMYAARQQAQPALAIILIDSLDEAVTTTGTTFVKLLTQLSKSTSLPSWVRFVLTSRLERRVLRGFEPLKPYHLQETSNDSLTDIQQYVEERITRPALQKRLQVNQVQPQVLIDEVKNFSNGNFLYTTLLLNDIEAGRQALNDLAALPKSIDDIYHGFLSRFSEEDWSDRYKPIFGVLTVAQEPISERQIANFTKINPEDVRDSIRIARQFFDAELDEQNKEKYSIFHQSLRDYLLDEDRNLDFWCNEQKQHQQIIDFCERTSKSWQELERIDAYGRKHLAQHLVEGARVEELHTLLSLEKNGKNAWFVVKDDEGDTAGFLADIELAWAEADEAYGREPGKSMGLQCRYALIKASINSMARIPTGLLIALVEHNYWKPAKALAYVYQIPDLHHRFKGLVALADSLLTTEPLKRHIQKLALKLVLSDKDVFSHLLSLIAMADELPEVVTKILESSQATEDDFARSTMLIMLRDKLSPAQHSQALKVALTIREEGYRVLTLNALANKLHHNLLPQDFKDSSEIVEDSAEGMRFIMESVEQMCNPPWLPWSLGTELLPQALKAAFIIQDQKNCDQALTAMADESSSLLSQVLQANSKQHEYYTEELAELADELPIGSAPRELESVLAAQAENRVEALMKLAENHLEALPLVLEAVAQWHHSPTSLRDLTDKIPTLISQGFKNASSSWDEQYQVRALMALPKLLESILSIQGDLNGYGVEALRIFVEQLPTSLSKIIEIAKVIQNKEYHTQAFTVFPKILKISQDFQGNGIENEKYRAKLLAELAHHYPDALPQALRTATAWHHTIQNNLDNPWYNINPGTMQNELLDCTEVLKNLFFYLANHPKKIDIWKNLWRDLSHQFRPDLLTNLATLTPILFQLGGKEAAIEAAQAIHEVTKWWGAECKVEESQVLDWLDEAKQSQIVNWVSF